MRPLNEMSVNLTYVQDTAYGKGIFAKTNIQKSAVVIHANILKIEAQRSKYSIEIGHNQHAIAEETLVFANHSCEPTVYVQHKQNMIYMLASREIQPNEQICFDYETTEASIVAFNQCNCASPQCRISLLGFASQEKLLRAIYPDYFFMPHLIAQKETLSAMALP